MDKESSILPWVEASTLLGGTLIAAIATSSISLYQINEMDDKVDKLVSAVTTLNYNQGIAKNDIQTLKSNGKKTQAIFIKFSDSVDRLSIAVAKLEGSYYAKER